MNMNIGNELIYSILLYMYILVIIVYFIVSIRNFLVSPEFIFIWRKLKNKK
jgi:uncharacterized protein HemY